MFIVHRGINCRSLGHTRPTGVSNPVGDRQRASVVPECYAYAVQLSAAYSSSPHVTEATQTGL